MYYGSGTVVCTVRKFSHTRVAEYGAAGGYCCICSTKRQQTSWPPSWKYDVISEIWLCQ